MRYIGWVVPTVAHQLREARLAQNLSIAQVAEVEVDRETGQIHLRKIVSASDVGTVLNPIGVTGQMALAPILGRSPHDLWQLRLLEEL